MLDQVVDELLSVTGVTTLDEVEELSSSETTVRVRQVEWPQEVVHLLEVRTNSVDLVDQVLNGLDTVLTQSTLDDLVVRQGDSLGVDLTVTSLVDQLSDGSQVRVTVGDVRLSQSKQLGSSLGHLNENTRVDTGQTEQLQDLSWLRWDLRDTLDSDDEHQLWLGLNVERVGGLGVTLSLNQRALSISVLLVVGSGSLSDSLSLLLVGLDVSITSFTLSLLSPERWLTDRQHSRRLVIYEKVLSSSKGPNLKSTYGSSGGLVSGTLLQDLSVGLGLLDLSLRFQSTGC